MKKFLSFLVFLALIVLPLDIIFETLHISSGTREPEPLPTGTIWDEADPGTPLSRDMPLTRANVLRILDELDPDGAFILRSTEDGYDFMDFIVPSETIGEGYGSIETAVHEHSHYYTFTPTGARFNKIQDRYQSSSEWIYIGKGQHIDVPLTDVFPSSDMNDTIPESLRTHRFDPYLNGDPLQAANQEGVYGLLNEFTAYCWGTHNSLMLEGLAKQGTNLKTYLDDFVSYAEFRYYILHYMLYAKEHNPGVYAGIMDNSDFRRAFTIIDSMFAGFAEARKNESFINDWNALTDEMRKPEYVNMAQLLAE